MSAPAQSPAPAAGPAEGAHPTREAALSVLLREGEATAAQLAGSLGVSVQAMRRHLRSLEDDGLVEASPSHEGPGRPSNRWRLTAQGQGRFPDGSENFALGLLHTLTENLPADTLELVLRQQAEQKAADYRRLIGSGPLGQRLERLVELRRKEGYVAECRRDDDPNSSGATPAPAWVISEFHCSVVRIAEKYPVVCDQELRLIRHTFPDCAVDRVHWRLEGGHSCGFRIAPLAASPAPAP
ncbi:MULTISPECIES: iron-sulfur cluster biosynthesis transcriptional regulator SufR [unclassified Cyanobium]|uniref:iron-sulfur cluster biosynthesis transcriptional regulator SufR n=1 Tax=unclassified Cyanobium TaxID=2627006 RepID=UPI0020CEF6F9|nr:MULTISPECIES: iron-sulfur cluster biosynthesis transcriptional regulator SufR [unclassified Cyanobium]MCP9835170.1 iron-sulfur cluster biosynthesis transcriptional regulator SufR [Cyanobium sp. La Preciosa 7G6]MCP9937934.1 iron-sulfur cluster biosynthesis transcriptional regulator SufR [Cyanobium sp. Aljojuca 7A6]